MYIAIIVGGRSMQELGFDSKGGYTTGIPMVSNWNESERAGNLGSLEELMEEHFRAAAAKDRSSLQRAVQLSDASRVIVTQAMDTLLESARALVGVNSKAIVVTETLDFAKPIGTGVSFNLGVAVGVVQVLPPGVYVIADGRVHPLERVRMNTDLGRLEIAPQPADAG